MEFLTHVLIRVTSFSYKLRLQKKKGEGVEKIAPASSEVVFSGKQKHGYNQCQRPPRSQQMPVLCPYTILNTSKHPSCDFSIQWVGCWSYNISALSRISMCLHWSRASWFHLVPTVILMAGLHSFADDMEFPDKRMFISRKRETCSVFLPAKGDLCHIHSKPGALLEAM